jgi:hypothetical protein
VDPPDPFDISPFVERAQGQRRGVESPLVSNPVEADDFRRKTAEAEKVYGYQEDRHGSRP